MQEIKRNFHVPIPDSLYRSLRAEAQRRGKPATKLVRELLEQWEKRLREETLRSEIADYAFKEAGSTVDLDPDLEAAGIEAWNAGTARSRRRKARKR
jgi:hypothetical protein